MNLKIGDKDGKIHVDTNLEPGTSYTMPSTYHPGDVGNIHLEIIFEYKNDVDPPQIERAVSEFAQFQANPVGHDTINAKQNQVIKIPDYDLWFWEGWTQLNVYDSKSGDRRYVKPPTVIPDCKILWDYNGGTGSEEYRMVKGQLEGWYNKDGVKQFQTKNFVSCSKLHAGTATTTIHAEYGCIGANVKPFPAAHRPGFALIGWTLDKEGLNFVTDDTVILSNSTLFAQWRKCSIFTYDGSSKSWIPLMPNPDYARKNETDVDVKAHEMTLTAPIYIRSDDNKWIRNFEGD